MKWNKFPYSDPSNDILASQIIPVAFLPLVVKREGVLVTCWVLGAFNWWGGGSRLALVWLYTWHSGEGVERKCQWWPCVVLPYHSEWQEGKTIEHDILLLIGDTLPRLYDDCVESGSEETRTPGGEAILPQHWVPWNSSLLLFSIFFTLPFYDIYWWWRKVIPTNTWWWLLCIILPQIQLTVVVVCDIILLFCYYQMSNIPIDYHCWICIFCVMTLLFCSGWYVSMTPNDDRWWWYYTAIPILSVMTLAIPKYCLLLFSDLVEYDNTIVSIILQTFCWQWLTSYYEVESIHRFLLFDLYYWLLYSTDSIPLTVKKKPISAMGLFCCWLFYSVWLQLLLNYFLISMTS